MRRRSFLIGATALLVTASVAEARMHAPYRGHRIVPVGGVTDIVASAPAAAYSFRKLRSAYVGPSLRVQRASDTTQQDIGFTAGGDLDTAAAATFCAATTCYVHTWYDQSGNARHVTNAAVTSNPTLVLNCNGSLPCIRNNGNNLLNSANVTPATGNGSLSGVSRVDSATLSTCAVINYARNQLTTHASGANWLLYNDSGTLFPPAALQAWHAAAGVIAGAGSTINLDGVETAGSMAASPLTAGPVSVAGGHSLGVPCSHVEAIAWDNYALTPAERVAVVNNQRNYWAPLPLDNFATPAAAYSFRKLKSTYAGPAIRLRRASDNAEQDIGFLGFTGFTGAPIDTAAAASHCASTTCSIKTIYDQSGNARDATQATPANQPVYLANCQNGLPCAVSTATAQVLVGPSITPAGSQSFSLVAKSASPENCSFVKTASNFLASNSGGTWWVLFSTAALIDDHAVHGAWHSGQAVLQASGTGSTLITDNYFDYTGAIGPNLAAGTIRVSEGGPAGTIPCNTAEAVWWNGYGLTVDERTALTNNQRSFWGF